MRKAGWVAGGGIHFLILSDKEPLDIELGRFAGKEIDLIDWLYLSRETDFPQYHTLRRKWLLKVA